MCDSILPILLSFICIIVATKECSNQKIVEVKAEVLWYECLKSCRRPGISRRERPLTICLSPWRSWRGRLGERLRSGIELKSRLKPLSHTPSRQATRDEHDVCPLWAKTFYTAINISTEIKFELWQETDAITVLKEEHLNYKRWLWNHRRGFHPRKNMIWKFDPNSKLITPALRRHVLHVLCLQWRHDGKISSHMKNHMRWSCFTMYITFEETSELVTSKFIASLVSSLNNHQSWMRKVSEVQTTETIFYFSFQQIFLFI